jgi:Gpi18-like mannosyltransferase
MKMFQKNKYLFISILITIFGFIIIHDLIGDTFLKHSYWDSYTLQAMSWREGNMTLKENYSWLEIAVYYGKYYVSFPPIPSVVMLPFTFIFGEETPNNAILMVYTIACVVAAYKIFKHFGSTDRIATFWSVFTVLGCNALSMAFNGGVWFQAQILNMAFCLFGILAAVKNKRILSMALIALAVGCRPFSLFYFPALIAYFIIQDRNKGLSVAKSVAKMWKIIILPIVIIGSYMAYNYVRFDNPLEFGHNYLPEFATGDAQFGLQYFMPNLTNIFRPITMTKDLALEFPSHNGFMFFIANPIFIILFVELIKDLKNRKFNVEKLIILICMLLNLFTLLIHKTFGGWQFGARYMIDLIPFVVLYIVKNIRDREIRLWEKAVAIFAVMFNAYGALILFLPK